MEQPIAQGHGAIDVDVAIIGAGPAGLTAGYLLTRQGKSVAIIEKDATYVGGISRTVEHEGYRFDIGGEAETAADAANKATQKQRVVMGVGVKGGWKLLTDREPARGERG